jgi:hypothetical protein
LNFGSMGGCYELTANNLNFWANAKSTAESRNYR